MSSKLLDDLKVLDEKAALPGTVRVWGKDNIKYQKQRDGSWMGMGRDTQNRPEPITPTAGLMHARQAPELVIGGTLSKPPKPPRATPIVPKIAIPTGRKWLDKVPGMPESSMVKNFNEKDPKPIRKALHEHIQRTFLQHVEPADPDKKPIALFVIGAPATGKSSLIKGVARADFVQVDPESVKEMIPEYAEAVEMSGRNAAEMVREESIFVAKKVRDKAVEDLKSLVINGTGDDTEPYEDAFRDLKELGYHIQLVMPHVDPVEGKRRAAARGGDTGRWVPDEAFEEAEQIQKNYSMLADLADEAALFDMTGKVPTLVHSKVGGKSVDHDKAYMKKFRGKDESVYAALQDFFSEGPDPDAKPGADADEEPEVEIDPAAPPVLTTKEVFKRAKEGLKAGRSEEDSERLPKYKKSEGVLLAHYGDEHLYA